MKTQCKHGHEMTPENTYVYKSKKQYTFRKCISCRNARLVAWKLKHPGRMSELKRLDRSKNPEKVRAQEKRQRVANPEACRKKKQSWRKRNPDLVSASRQRRRARQLNQLGNFSVWMLRFYRFRQEGKCWYCGVEMLRDVAKGHPQQETLEHLTPLSRHGMHTQANTVLACANCNSVKNDSTEEEFRAHRAA